MSERKHHKRIVFYQPAHSYRALSRLQFDPPRIWTPSDTFSPTRLRRQHPLQKETKPSLGLD